MEQLKERWNSIVSGYEEQNNPENVSEHESIQAVSQLIAHTKPDEFQQQLLEALQLERDRQDGLFRSAFVRTQTTAGRMVLWSWIEVPLKSAEEIEKRQMDRTNMTASDRESVQRKLGTMESEWRSLCWCWSESDTKKEMMRQVEFEGLIEPLNRVPCVQSAYHHLRVSGMPLLHCISPLVPIIITYLLLRFAGAGVSFRQCWDISSGMLKNAYWWGGGGRAKSMGGMLVQAMKWAWYALFFINACVIIYHSYRHYKLLYLVYDHARSAARWVRSALSFMPSDKLNAMPKEQLAQLRTVSAWSEEVGERTLGVFTHAHTYLPAYQLLRSIKGCCSALLKNAATIDAHMSVHTLLTEERSRFTVPERADSATPVLRLEQVAHPILKEGHTTHTFDMDKHAVLTGANGSGKSTTIRMVLLNVLLAQSLGISTARRMVWTPFKLFRGHLLTPDECGEESLFQAQIRRIESFIVDTKELESGLSLLVVDEIFNSTNPSEAMLLSYAYAQRLNSMTRSSRMLLSTHYPIMTKLAAQHPESFRNWCMKYDANEPYKLERDEKCTHSSAIDMAKRMSRVFTARDHAKLEKSYLTISEHMQNTPVPDIVGRKKKLPKKKTHSANNLGTDGREAACDAAAAIDPNKENESRSNSNSRAIRAAS
jgi:hypothetical protein